MRLLLTLCAVPLLLVACGGDGNSADDADATGATNESAPELSDTEYVQALCDGVEEWARALAVGSIDELRQTRDKIEADARALNPPQGIDAYHEDYVAYLDRAESDPTLLTTQTPPLPEGEVLERLSEAERKADCAYPFFNRVEETATPGG